MFGLCLQSSGVRNKAVVLLASHVFGLTHHSTLFRHACNDIGASRPRGTPYPNPSHVLATALFRVVSEFRSIPNKSGASRYSLKSDIHMRLARTRSEGTRPLILGRMKNTQFFTDACPETPERLVNLNSLTNVTFAPFQRTAQGKMWFMTFSVRNMSPITTGYELPPQLSDVSDVNDSTFRKSL